MARSDARQSASSPARSSTQVSSVKSVAENIKETLESIVVAFIMAFVFRAFIVEAFVIPTGSMADTLYGAQYLNTCSTCGYQYALGALPQLMAHPIDIPLTCPNCNTRPDEVERDEVRFPNSGDRILVHKWPFYMPGDTFGPERWKVTVFKDPNDGVTNFIKRLVGEPGEVLQIIDGDVFTAPLAVLEEKEPTLIGDLDGLRREVYAYRFDRSRLSAERIRDRYAELAIRVLPYMSIQRKLPDHPEAQESLWSNVYNNDFLPDYKAFSSEWVSGWRPVTPEAGSAWAAQQREMAFESESSVPLAIAFSGKPIDDFYAYNQQDAGRSDNGRNHHVVGDVRLSLVWQPQRGNGGLVLRLNRDRDEFVAHVDLDGSVRLEKGRMASPDDRASPAEPKPMEAIGRATLAPFEAGRAYAVEFINVDYRVCVKIDGEEVVATTDEQYAPDIEKLEAVIRSRTEGLRWRGPIDTEVSIAGYQMACVLRHVQLQRDVFYTSPGLTSERELPPPGKPPGTPPEPNPYFGWPGWGTEGMPILLRPQHIVDGRKYGGEFFMLGDNSPASKDSRLWWQIGLHLSELGAEYQVGTVPRDQLIGEAFFVYWPSGYRGTWFPRLGIVPNFGRMRWIR